MSTKGMMLATVAAVVSSAFAGENLLTGETDFEAGMEGWYGQTPGAPLPVRVADGAIGGWSMELKGGALARCAFVWDRLKPETSYTVSFWLKGVGRPVDLSVITEGWKWIGAIKKIAPAGWQRETYTFKTGKKGTFNRAFYLLFQQTGAQPTDWIRLDGIKVEEGAAATDYVVAPLRLFAEIGEPGEIHYADDGAPVMKVRAVGAAFAAAAAPVAEVVDANGRLVAARPLANGEASIALAAANEVGYYAYRTRLRDAAGRELACRETPFVVTRRAPRNPFFGIQFSCGVPVAALQRVGFTWTRANTKFWMWEEQDGPRPLTGREKVQSPRTDGMKVLGTAWGTHAPKWARGSGWTRWTDDVNKATNYLANLVFTTTNAVDHYEIINEPDLSLPGEKGVTFEQACAYYADVVKLCARYIHAAGKPVTIDVSGVADGNRLVEHVLKTTPESVDIVAVHPYSWPRQLAEDGRALADPETGGFLDDLRRKAEILRKYGKSRMVIGELGWSIDMAAPYASANGDKYGWYLARMFLLARTFPVEYLIWFSLANCPEAGLFDYGIWRASQEDGVRPLAIVAAACEAARRIPAPGDGAVTAIEQDGVYLLGWERGDRAAFAYWTDEEMVRPLGALGTPSLAAADFTGRSLAPDALTLSGGPVYLDVAKEEAAAFLPKLRAALAAAYATRPPLVREEATVTRLTGDWKTYDFANDPAAATLGTVRGDIQPPDPCVQWDSPADLSAKTLLKWDDANLYFFARVTDDTHCTPKQGAQSYMNDVIQLAFDPKDNAKKNAGYLADDCEFGICEGAKLFAWVRPGGKAGYVEEARTATSRIGTTTEYRVAIPWKAMGLDAAPKTLGGAFAVCDNDDNARARYWIAWGNGIVDGKRPARFKKLILK